MRILFYYLVELIEWNGITIVLTKISLFLDILEAQK